MVLRHWASVRVAEDVIAAVRDSVTEDLQERRQGDIELLATQRRRLKTLETRRQKLIDAYLAEAIPVADLKPRQAALAVEQRDAERLIELASSNHALAESRLNTALGLLEHCERLYLSADEHVRQQLNQAFFSALKIDEHKVVSAELMPPFAELTDRSIGLRNEEDGLNDSDDDESDRPEGDGGRGGKAAALPGRASGVAAVSASPAEGLAAVSSQATKNPTHDERGRGSDVTLLAEGVGFEPTVRVTPHSGFQDRRHRPLGEPSSAAHTSPGLSRRGDQGGLPAG